MIISIGNKTDEGDMCSNSWLQKYQGIREKKGYCDLLSQQHTSFFHKTLLEGRWCETGTSNRLSISPFSLSISPRKFNNERWKTIFSHLWNMYHDIVMIYRKIYTDTIMICTKYNVNKINNILKNLWEKCKIYYHHYILYILSTEKSYKEII